jgi:hypothetical protein
MAFGNHDSRLDELTLACLAFRESRVDGRTYLEAYGLGLEGELVVLAPPRVAPATAAERSALFASLLLRGLRAPETILVEHDGCEVLRSRIEGKRKRCFSTADRSRHDEDKENVMLARTFCDAPSPPTPAS